MKLFKGLLNIYKHRKFKLYIAAVAQPGTAQAWNTYTASLFPQGFPGSKQLFASLSFGYAPQKPGKNDCSLRPTVAV